MAIIKCPRCDINFIREEEGYCSICKREMRGEMPKDDAVEMCIECGEHPAVPGEELCAFCLADRKAAGEALEDDAEEEGGEGEDDELGLGGMELDPLQSDDEIPEEERERIHRELGFDDGAADEEEEDKEEPAI